MANVTIQGKMFQTVVNSRRAVRDEDLRRVETLTGQLIPAQLHGYYLQFNGGWIVPADLAPGETAWVRLFWRDDQPASEFGPATCLERILSINEEPNVDLLRTWGDFRFRIPHDTLSFACDPGGNLFLIGTGEANSGVIYFWLRSHEADAEAGELPSYENTAFVANSFEEFVLNLRAEPRKGEALEDWVRRQYGA